MCTLQCLDRCLVSYLTFYLSIAFNSFADNIYYSDSDRANLYLGGGAEPTSTQSLAYLLRNDILTTVEDERAEVKYLLKEVNKKANGETIVVGGDGLDMDEITGLSKTANVAMKKYLDLVPPSELTGKSALVLFHYVNQCAQDESWCLAIVFLYLITLASHMY